MDKSEIKICENNFISRIRENMKAVENSGGIKGSDDLAELRKLTGGKLLRNELEAKYPIGKSLTMRITKKAGLFGREQRLIELTGKVIVRLDRLIETGCDEEPISLGELNTILNRESDSASRGCCDCVLGLFSLTGWNEDAKQFVINEPGGSGWASNAVYPILIGQEITALVRDKKNSKINEYIQCFCGLNIVERQQVCKDAIKRAILVQEFANLKKIASENSFNLEFVKNMAGQLAAECKDMVLKKISGVGLVLKKKI